MHIDFMRLAFSYAVLLCAYILYAAVWVRISNHFQNRLTFLQGSRVWFYSQLGKYLPGKGFIYLARSILCKRYGVEYRNSLAGSVIELAMQLLSAFILVLLSMPFIRGVKGFVSDWRLAAVFVLLGFIMIHPKLFTFLANKALKVFKRECIVVNLTYADMAIYLSLYMVINLLMGISFYIFARSLYPVSLYSAPFFAMAFIASFSLGIVSFPAPAGIGVREGLLAVFLSNVLTPPAGLRIALYARLWSIACDILNAGIFAAVNAPSGYREVNPGQRKKAAAREIAAWGREKDRFTAYRKLWARARDEDFLPSHPLHVDIELSDACNLRCRMCIHSWGPQEGAGFMKDELVEKLIHECAAIGVYSVKFNWRGEATLNDFLPEAVKKAKQKDILEVQINTNGLPPKRQTLIQCAQNGIDRIIFSVDGFSKETYESQRINGDYSQLLKNIHLLLEWKKQNRRSKPLVRVQMVRTKINFHEVNGFVRHWGHIVDDVRVSDATDRGRGGTLIVGDQVSAGRRRCPQPFQRLTVAKDGRVSPCCVDWYQHFVVGDTGRQSLTDIWNNQKMNYIRDIQRRNQQDKVDICRDCFVKESYIWGRKKCLR